MTLPKLTVPVLSAALVASVITVVIMLFSPVMAESGTCGSLGGLILRGGETRNNGGDISTEQFDSRVDECRAATIGSSALLLVPLGVGGLSWWGAMTLSERNRRP